MRQILLIVSVLFFSLNTKSQNKTKRSECFFGVHLDYHCSTTDSALGRYLSEEQVDTFLQIIKPDFLQIDCKGHKGISSYPTKVGYHAPSFDKDPYPIFRKATKKNGVRLYAHYSGVYDIEAIKHHKNWARIDENGKIDTLNTSVFGVYVDSLMIPQIKELIDDYQLDGVWVDGDCWGAAPDYSPKAAKAWKNFSGKELPKSKNAPMYKQFLDFNRFGFRNYVQHYTTVLHKYKPEFEIASNWAYSSFMPEPADLPLDFLSGDLQPYQSAQNATFESRCISKQGKHWDLMAWGFAQKFDKSYIKSHKTAIMLQQEAAQVISQGGGFQIYYNQNKDASVQSWITPTVKEVGDFCKERKEFCFHNQSVKEVALFYSTVGYKSKSQTVYQPWNGELDEIKGALNLLLDNTYSVDIQMEHHFLKTMNQYPAIVIPEWQVISPEFVVMFKKYVQNGGKLLIIGHKTVTMFADIIPAKTNPAILGNLSTFYLNDLMTGVQNAQPFQVSDKIHNVASLYNSDLKFPYGSIAFSFDYGKGKIGVISADICHTAMYKYSFAYKQLVGKIMNDIYPTPLVEIAGKHHLQIHIAEMNQRTQIHLLNTSGSGNSPNVLSLDDIKPQQNIAIQIRVKSAPKKVMLEPTQTELKFKYENGILKLNIPEVKIHEIIDIY